jgi:hypothetical protein
MFYEAIYEIFLIAVGTLIGITTGALLADYFTHRFFK